METMVVSREGINAPAIMAASSRFMLFSGRLWMERSALVLSTLDSFFAVSEK